MKHERTTAEQRKIRAGHRAANKEQEYITRADDPELWSELEHLTAETEKALKTLIL